MEQHNFYDEAHTYMHIYISVMSNAQCTIDLYIDCSVWKKLVFLYIVA